MLLYQIKDINTIHAGCKPPWIVLMSLVTYDIRCVSLLTWFKVLLTQEYNLNEKNQHMAIQNKFLPYQLAPSFLCNFCALLIAIMQRCFAHFWLYDSRVYKSVMRLLELIGKPL